MTLHTNYMIIQKHKQAIYSTKQNSKQKMQVSQ